MSDLARLIIAALEWDAALGFAPAEGEVERALALGVGGFVLLGGDGDAVAALTARLRAAARHPLLIMAAPHAAATAPGARDALAVSAAARQGAREARGVGANWVMAPVDAVDAVQREGVLACIGRFPGETRAAPAPRGAPSTVMATRDELERDLAPYLDAIDAGAASIMTAHVAYPALDASGAPATASHAIVHGVLRQAYGFEGLIVTAPLVEGSGWEPRGEGHMAARAVAAGCDLLFHPNDPAAVLHGLEVAAGRTVPRAQLDASLARRDHWARWAEG